VEIKIGIQNVNREVVLESTASAAEVETAFSDALAGDGLLRLTDQHGRKVLVPVSSIGYLDIGEENARRVGFGSV
jgi:hypothetical protein